MTNAHAGKRVEWYENCETPRRRRKEGYYADLTVFDEEALKNGTPDQAALKNTGRAIPVR